VVTDIVKTLNIFQDPGDVIEIRVIGSMTASGYFKDAAKAAQAVRQYDGKANIYFVLNKIKGACHARQPDVLKPKVKTTTGDSDIECRRWILLDFDPARPADVSSSNEEKAVAYDRMKDASRYLKQQGFPLPVVADSGNGYHLLFRIDMQNDAASAELIKGFLQALDMLFSDGVVQVDTAVFNAARITKLYGTMAVKGGNTSDRPHRRSGIEYVPDAIEVVPVELIKKIADMLPKQEQRQTQYNGNIDFDIDDWIRRYGIRVRKTSAWSGGKKYVLEQCPFNAAHGKDSAIIKLSGGAIAFHCFHNGCQGRTWRDFRELYEPGCYSREQNTRPVQASTRHMERKKPDLKPDTSREVPEEVQKLLSRGINLADVKEPDNQDEAVLSGIAPLDKLLGGFAMGMTTLWTGLNAAGKSTLLGQLILEAVDQGYNVFVFSGELQAHRFQYWIDLQAAGKKHLQRQISQRTSKEYFIVHKDARARIHAWYDNRLFIYDNRSGMNYAEILKVMDAHAVYRKCRLFLLDNLMRLDIRELDKDLYEAQSIFVNSISDFAQNKNVHIHLVAHPRKVMGSIITKMDVSGSGDLTNRADNVLAVHRVTPALKEEVEKAKKHIPKPERERILSATNLIEIFKDRDGGAQDVLIPLLYCEGSKRLVDKEHPELENKKYGWEKQAEEAEHGDAWEPYYDEEGNVLPF